MAFQIRRESRAASDALGGTVYVLEDSHKSARAEVAPSLGFNCYRWLAARNGEMLDLLYADPQFFHAAKPTRSGIPVLFPFPNRIRDGRFAWAGREYSLPLNDPSGKNAIHGFACRRPWRVVDEGADASSAWVTGDFTGSVDAPECRELWPADYSIRLTARLREVSLQISAVVSNPDRVPLPFGLGFHPYFRVPPRPADAVDSCFVSATPDRLWLLKDSLPTGEVIPVDPARDLRTPRPFTNLNLDDVLRAGRDNARDSLYKRGSIWTDKGATELLRLETSAGFRELVAFTPPHRQAFCLEPYTCTTDAINLRQQGIEAGLMVLPPGAEWRGEVLMRLVR